jgi:hypothetical protein
MLLDWRMAKVSESNPSSQKGSGVMQKHPKPPDPVHVQGMHKGEELVLNKGREPGRNGSGQYRSSRDSTGINAEHEKPIHPAMPNIPPA